MDFFSYFERARIGNYLCNRLSKNLDGMLEIITAIRHCYYKPKSVCGEADSFEIPVLLRRMYDVPLNRK